MHLCLYHIFYYIFHIHIFFLNINYWCANQTVIQRSLAAKDLGEAQKGLLVGGVMKYFMAVLIVIPGIALFGIVGENGISEPDMAFPYLVNTYLPTGVKGIVLCALFASLMSTVDSTFNSLATLFSIDIYKEYLKPEATDDEVVSTGRRTILFTLLTGITMGLVLLYIKFENPETAFTHTLNELRYYINCGIVVLICSTIFMVAPSKKLVMIGFFSTIPLHLVFIAYFPEMNYFVRAFYVIVSGLLFVSISTVKSGWQPWNRLFVSADKKQTYYAAVLLASLILLHVVFH